MTEVTEQTPGTGQGGGQLPKPITDPYVTEPGDTLASIAERAGHSGEWLELAMANIDQVDIADASDMVKATIVADRAQFAGVSLNMPPTWNIGGQTKPADEARGDRGQEREPAGDPKSVAEALEEFEQEHEHRRRR